LDDLVVTQSLEDVLAGVRRFEVWQAFVAIMTALRHVAVVTPT